MHSLCPVEIQQRVIEPLSCSPFFACSILSYSRILRASSSLSEEEDSNENLRGVGGVLLFRVNISFRYLQPHTRLDFRRLPGPVFDPPRRETAGRVTRWPCLWRNWKVDNFSVTGSETGLQFSYLFGSKLHQALPYPPICTKRSCDVVFMKMKAIWFCLRKTISGSYLKQNNSDLVLHTRTIFLKGGGRWGL